MCVHGLNGQWRGEEGLQWLTVLHLKEIVRNLTNMRTTYTVEQYVCLYACTRVCVCAHVRVCVRACVRARLYVYTVRRELPR